MLSTLEKRFGKVVPDGEFCSLRYVRSVDSMHLPGALIDGFRFTL